MIWAVATEVVQADITVNRVFSDHMVLQQNAVIKVWGTADAGQKILVKFDQQSQECAASADGAWTAEIKTPAAGGPFQLEVSAVGGDAKILFEDILVGEVWICSGQSNMEWSVAGSAFPEREIDAAKDYARIRLFRVDHNPSLEPVKEISRAVGWDVCNPETVKDFSAVAYQFAKRLHDELGVPVGLIQSTWGGTPCESWISYDAMERTESLKELLQHWREVENQMSPHRPANLYNGMIAPLQGVAFQGAIWYQGESNVGRGAQYRTLFPLMIEDWRAKLAGGRSFPFYFVEIAPYNYGDRDPIAAPEVWDAQLYTMREVENTGMVVISDIGNVKDIHPRNKHDVGARLAGWALGGCYREMTKKSGPNTGLLPSGPIYRSMNIEGNRIRIEFDYVGDGLKSKDDAELIEFTIAGEDGKFVPAKATIEDASVVVWSDEVANPRHVRFGWTNTSEPNLFNSVGLPAAPFRTDSLPMLSEAVAY
jgi:sialate O-acetylesterase